MPPTRQIWDLELPAVLEVTQITDLTHYHSLDQSTMSDLDELDSNRVVEFQCYIAHVTHDFPRHMINLVAHLGMIDGGMPFLWTTPCVLVLGHNPETLNYSTPSAAPFTLSRLPGVKCINTMKMLARESRSLHPELLMQRFGVIDISSLEPGTTLNISRLKKQFLPSGLVIDIAVAYFRGQLNSQDSEELTYGTVSFPSKYLQRAKEVCPGGWMTYWGQSPRDMALVTFSEAHPVIY